MSDHIRLIVGLGNPGPQYETTRHNAGAWFTQKIAENYHCTLKQDKKFLALHQKVLLDTHECHLFIPLTFMNHSGRAVAALCHYYHITPQQILVAHDELDFSPGTVKIKKDGGHAGHNGLRDIIKALGTADFYRLRIGIGHPGNKDSVHDYVLSQPGKTEKLAIEHAIDEAVLHVRDMVAGYISKVMQALHTNING